MKLGFFLANEGEFYLPLVFFRHYLNHLNQQKGFVMPKQVIVSSSTHPVSKRLQHQQELAAQKECRIAEEQSSEKGTKRAEEKR